MDRWDAQGYERWRADFTTAVVEGLVTGACESDAGVAGAMQAMHDAAYRGALGGYGDGFLLTGGTAMTEVLWAFVSSWAGNVTDGGPGPVVWVRPDRGSTGGSLPEQAYTWLGRRPSRPGRDRWQTLMRWLGEVGTRVFVIEGVDRFAKLDDMPMWLRDATRQGVVVIATRPEQAEGHANLRVWMHDIDLSDRGPVAA